MFDIFGSTQASFFGNFSDIRPNTQNTTDLVKLLSRKKMLPGTFLEFLPGLSPIQRIRYESENHEWSFVITSDRMYIEKTQSKVNDNNNHNYYENFVNEALDIYKIILDYFKLNGHRISFITRGLLPELPDNKLEEVFRKFILPIDFYSTNLPLEWTSRLVSRLDTDLNGSSETLNVITNINRKNGMLSINNDTMDFDRIVISFDINTFQGNKNTRFSADNIEPFYLESINIRIKIIEEIREKLNG